MIQIGCKKNALIEDNSRMFIHINAKEKTSGYQIMNSLGLLTGYFGMPIIVGNFRRSSCSLDKPVFVSLPRC